MVRMPANRIARALCLGGAIIALWIGAACTTSPRRVATMREIYSESRADGFREGIEVLREDMKRGPVFGYEDPVIPLVKPPESMEIYVWPYKIGNDIAIGGYEMRVFVEPYQWAPDLFPQRERPKQGRGSTLPTAPAKE